MKRNSIKDYASYLSGVITEVVKDVLQNSCQLTNCPMCNMLNEKFIAFHKTIHNGYNVTRTLC